MEPKEYGRLLHIKVGGHIRFMEDTKQGRYSAHGQVQSIQNSFFLGERYQVLTDEGKLVSVTYEDVTDIIHGLSVQLNNAEKFIPKTRKSWIDCLKKLF